MDATKVILVLIGLVIVALAIGFALQWAAPLTSAGVQGLHALTDTLYSDSGNPYEVQAVPAAKLLMSPVGDAFSGLILFGAAMAVYFVWSAVVSIFGRFFA